VADEKEEEEEEESVVKRKSADMYVGRPNKTAHLHTGHATLCDFFSSQHPLLFLQTCGH